MQLRQSTENSSTKKVDDSPTFNYFNASVSGLDHLEDDFERARKYIERAYPDAVAGSCQDEYISKEKMDAAGISPTDQYFLRIKTYRTCIGEADNELGTFIQHAENYVKANPRRLKLYKPYPKSDLMTDTTSSFFKRHQVAASAVLMGAIIAGGYLLNMQKK